MAQGGGVPEDLAKAERYFLALAGIDRPQSRLWAMQFKLAFDQASRRLFFSALV